MAIVRIMRDSLREVSRGIICVKHNHASTMSNGWQWVDLLDWIVPGYFPRRMDPVDTDGKAPTLNNDLYCLPNGVVWIYGWIGSNNDDFDDLHIT